MRIDPKHRSRRGALARLPPPWLLLASLLALGTIRPALAEDRNVPTPNQVIYPGDVIRDSMLTDVSIYDLPAPDGALVESRSALVGKVAKRTLLPGRGIVEIAVANPKAVTNGAEVKIIYRDGGLTIVSSALALESGGVGDTIKVRNADSGLTISGVIQADGSVNVGDS